LKPIEECSIAVAGLGLMGGAIARALKALKPERIIALDMDGETIMAALGEGIIDEGYSLAAETEAPGTVLPRADFVYLCLNPSTMLRFLERWMPAFKNGALITDIAGIKGNIVTAVEKTLRRDLDFIPGHPMAGAEKGGFENSGLVNFRGKNYIITPLAQNRRENLSWLKNIIHRMGFGRITETTAEEHDRKIAFTSQLCHVIAGALIDCEEDTAITRFGGGSFEDLTRIAMLNAPMWTELFIENKTELLRRIEQFEGSLDAFKALINAGDARALEERLSAVRERRVSMNTKEIVR
jgi:prephenate dehydrogenase